MNKQKQPGGSDQTEQEVFRYAFNLFAFPDGWFAARTAEELRISEAARQLLIRMQEGSMKRKKKKTQSDHMRYKPTPHPCPVCGKTEFPNSSSYYICEECGWEDDGYQEENPDEAGFANELSLNEYRAKYKGGWRPEWLLEWKKHREEIYKAMAANERKHVRITTTDGEQYSGYIDVFESRSDNEEDDHPYAGQGSVILLTDDGGGVCLFEIEIASVAPAEDDGASE